MKRDQIINTIQNVAENFDLVAKNTILNQNLEKHYNEIKTIIRLTDNRNNIKILDVGGGMGVNLLTLSKLKHGEEFRLIDRFDEYVIGTSMGTFNENSIERFKENNISFTNQDILTNTHLDCPNNYFDIVTIIDVIEHLQTNPNELLIEIYRVLKPNGVIYLSSPNLFGIDEIANFLLGKHIYMKFNDWIKTNYFSHFREYTYGEHKKLLEISGFVKIQTKFHEDTFWLRYKKGKKINALKYLFGFIVTKLFPFTKTSIVAIGYK